MFSLEYPTRRSLKMAEYSGPGSWSRHHGSSLSESSNGSSALQATQEEIEATIASNHVVVYALSTCPHCIEAKELLAAKGADAKIVDVDQMSAGDRNKATESLEVLTGETSVPAIWIGGQHIGDTNALKALINENKLDGMLKK